MNLKDTILNIAKKTRLVPFLEGKAGEGKTQFIRDLCDSEGLSLIILNASALEASDFTGLPSIQSGKTIFSRPAFLDYDAIFLDELDRVNNIEVRQSLLSLFQDRSINGHQYSGLIFGAGNGQAEGYDTIELDKALEDRIVRKKFSYSIAEKLEHLKEKHGAENSLLKFLEVKTEYFAQLSTRRLDYALSIVDDLLGVELILGPDLFRVYSNYLSGGIVTLKHIAANEYNFASLSPITRVALVNETLNNFETLLELKDSEIVSINEFLNELSAEEKSLYFSKLKEKVLNDSSMKEILQALDKKQFFKGQKLFLKELVGA